MTINLPDVFHFEESKPTFEDFGEENGMRYWWASDLINLLGYELPSNLASIKPINKAMAACAALGIPIHENFQAVYRQVDGNSIDDFKLSRFACYLTAMNGDSKKPQVASAQAYFATIAEAFSQYAQEIENIDRVVTRDELAQEEKALASTAKKAGVDQYPFFQNAGYRGMYNMNLNRVRTVKNTPSGRSPLDFMGSTELAANLFRITQTNEKIKRQNIRGQKPLEETAESVGKEVRKTMKKISDVYPEDLAPVDDINSVKKGIKATYKGLKKIDTSKKEK